MSVSFDSALTLQAATSHQCSRDADGDGERGRNGYPSDSAEAALIRDKLHVVTSENHDQMDEEASDSEETPCSSSGTDGEGVGATFGAQRGAAVGLCVGVEDTHRSTRRSEDGQLVVRGRQSTTFAGRRGAGKNHTKSSRRSNSRSVEADKPRRAAAINAQRVMGNMIRSEQRSHRQRDDTEQYAEKSQSDVRRSDDQSVGVSKPRRSVSVKAQRDNAVAKQCLDVEQDDDSDAYVSSVEDFNDESESDNDDDVLYQLCESEPVVERAQAKFTCMSKQLLQSDLSSCLSHQLIVLGLVRDLMTADSSLALY